MKNVLLIVLLVATSANTFAKEYVSVRELWNDCKNSSKDDPAKKYCFSDEQGKKIKALCSKPEFAQDCLRVSNYYQNKAKLSEARVLLISASTEQRAYFAEFDKYQPTLPTNMFSPNLEYGFVVAQPIDCKTGTWQSLFDLPQLKFRPDIIKNKRIILERIRKISLKECPDYKTNFVMYAIGKINSEGDKFDIWSIDSKDREPIAIESSFSEDIFGGPEPTRASEQAQPSANPFPAETLRIVIQHLSCPREAVQSVKVKGVEIVFCKAKATKLGAGPITIVHDKDFVCNTRVYKNKINGKFMCYYKSVLVQEYYYRDEMKNGSFKKFSDSGKLLEKGSYSKNNLVGTVEQYDGVSGMLKVRSFYKDNELDGIQSFYSIPSGKRIFSITWKNRKVEKGFSFDEFGKMTALKEDEIRKVIEQSAKPQAPTAEKLNNEFY